MSTDRFDELEIFVRAVEAGSFSEAARQLSLSASAVSKVIAKMENRLKVRLLYRTSRSLSLTAEGEVFLAATRDAVAAIKNIDSLMSDLTSRLDGRLRLYSVPALSHHMTHIIAGFLARNPEVSIDLEIGSGWIDLARHNIDIAVRIGPLEDSFEVPRKIADTKWVLCASPSYVAARGTPKVLQDLAQHNCLNFSHQLPWTLQGDLSLISFATAGNFSSNHAEMLRLVALHGTGIARLSEFVVANDIAEGRLISLLPNLIPSERIPIWALYQNRNSISFRAKKFLNYLCEELPGTGFRTSTLRNYSPTRPAQDSILAAQ